MGSSQAVVVFVEVHHLEAVELVGDCLDLLCLAGLHDLNAFGIPSRCQYVMDGWGRDRFGNSPLDVVGHIDDSELYLCSQYVCSRC